MAKKPQKLSKRKQREMLRKQGYKYSDYSKMNTQTRDRITELIISDKQEQKQQKRVAKTRQPIQEKPKKTHYESFKKRVSEKRIALHQLGFNDVMIRGKISDKKIDSIRLKDIESGNITPEKYSFLFYQKFDFDRVYKFKDNNRMFVAFRDFQGELDFADLLADFSKKSNDELVTFLYGIVNTPQTYIKGEAGTSSGRAGDYKFQVAEKETIPLFNQEARNETQKDRRALEKQKQGKNVSIKTKAGRKRKRQHFKGEKVGFQVLKDGHNVSHEEVTPRNLLIMANAIMYNVTEKDRVNFYNRFYPDITKHIPDMIQILPKQ